MGLKRLLQSKRGKTLPGSSSQPSVATTRDGTSPSSSSKISRDHTPASSSGQPPLVTASTIVFSIPGLRDEIFAYHAYELMKSYWRLTRPGLPVTRLALLRAHLELWHVEEEERLREECFLARWWPMPRPRDSTHEQLFSLSKQQVSQDPLDKYKRKAAHISTYTGRRRYQQWRKEWKLEIRIEPVEEDIWCMNVWREHCRRQRQELLLRERPQAHRADLDEVVA